jgi:hypothetical protein
VLRGHSPFPQLLLDNELDATVCKSFNFATVKWLCRANCVWLVALVADEAVAEEGFENMEQFCRRGTGWRRHEALNALRILEGLKQDVSPHMTDLGCDVTGNCI